MDTGREDKRPWDKWFWQDFESDTGLRLSSLAAQGLWMRMLSIMARSKVKGALLDGERPMEAPILARSVGEDVSVVVSLLQELEARGVSSRLEDGTIINRRMYQEHELRAGLRKVRAEAGRQGAIKRWNLTKEDLARLEDAKKGRAILGLSPYSLISSQRRTDAKNIANHTEIQWQNLKLAYDFTCPSCGKKEPEISLTKDHIIPISLGGSSHISNIQPLCQSCNSTKGRGKTKWQNMANQMAKQHSKNIAPSASASVSSSEYSKILTHWNEFAEKNGLVKIVDIMKGSAREAAVRARMAKPGFSFEGLLKTIGDSPFLLCKVPDKPFRATFDWVMKASNYQKIIEGNYLDRSNPTLFQPAADHLGALKEKR